MLGLPNISYMKNRKNALTLIFNALYNEAKKRYDTFLTEAEKSDVFGGGENLSIFANENRSQRNK